jgi:hypothetical protein
LFWASPHTTGALDPPAPIIRTSTGLFIPAPFLV